MRADTFWMVHGLGKGASIFDRDLGFQMPEVGPPVPLDDMHHFRTRVALGAEPRLVIEAYAIDLPMEYPSQVGLGSLG
jgi:hypothetical protein